MAWYNPASWFKNTPKINLRKANTSNNTTTIEESTPTQDRVLDTSTSEPTSTTPITNTTSTDTLVMKPSGSLLWDISRAYQEWKREREWKTLGTIVQENQEKATKLDDFNLDPYNTTSNNIDNPINGTVTTEWKDQTKTRDEAMSDAYKNTWGEPWWWLNWVVNRFLDKIFPITDKYWNKIKTAPDWSFSDDVNAFVNAVEQKVPIVGAYNVNQATKTAFWWDLEYKSPSGMVYSYKWINKDYLANDVSAYIQLENMYNNWQIWEYAFNALVDDLYEEYKDDWFISWHAKNVEDRDLNKTRWYGSIDKATFLSFIQNEKSKAQYQQDEYERRWIDLDSEQSQSRVANAFQYAVNQIWQAVETSNIATVEARQEFMWDAKQSFLTEVGRWDNVMTETYRTKAWLQRLYWVDDMYDIDPNTMQPEHRDIRNSIEINEQNYNQFVKNLTKYISLLPSYVDPNTWKLDTIPDYVIDPATWKTVTYQEMLFDWVSIIEWAWGNTYLWWDMSSPIDVLRKSSAQIAWAKADLTEWLWWRIWANAQYRLSNIAWATTNELAQQTLWRLRTRDWNRVSKSSWEIPFEFVDMDTSTLSTLTTNKSRAWRLMQSYMVKWLEYVPELWWSILEAFILDKWLSKIWTAWQLSFQNLLYRVPWMRNSLAWRQMALWLSYTAKAAQRLWTDQAIDAALSIWDAEPMSDISKKLSIWWTLLWEWLGILADLKVLWKSFSNYFKPEWIKYWGLTDPIKLMADNPWILNDYADMLGRWTVDESWKIVWDEYKLLLQDLWEYSKYLKKMSNEATDIVRAAIREWVDLWEVNMTFKEWVYNVLKQTFAQNSAMARAMTNLLTDSRANVADMIKYIWNLEWVIKIWPFISTIKVSDSAKTFIEKAVKNYDQKMDLIIDWWLVSWLNKWLTRQEVENLFNQWFLKSSSAWNDIWSAIDDYFIPIMEWDEVRYFPTDKWLKALNVETWVINNPLAIVTMSEDTQQLIDKLKTLSPSQRQLSDSFIDAIGETNAINRLAENIAWIDYLDICK